MTAAIGNARKISKHWLNQLLTRACSWAGGLSRKRKLRGKQSGAVMLETLAAISAASVVAGSALHFHTQAQRQALNTQVAVSASAFASALNLQQAAAALHQPTAALAFNAAGYPVAAGEAHQLTRHGCEALWSALVLSASPSLGQELAASAGWHASAHGDSCLYTYTEQAVGERAFRYSSATGQVTLLPAKAF